LGITGILFEEKENLEEKLLMLIHHRGASVNDGIG
jgi:hypothetical protein